MQAWLSIAYTVVALLVALYGANALLLAVLYWRHRHESTPPAPRPGDWPTVTVQLPIYNELYVVRRLIDAAAQLDYPSDRLQVQILDDSTDETTALARAEVARWRARGLNIDLLHRDDRSGFKAGALARGLHHASGEFVAIFDADFVPPVDFLRRTIPFLVARPNLGLVQTRWAHLNANHSALTWAQALALDGHFAVEHLARGRSGLLINFNGTAGVWRRTCIESSGGWQSDTLTEDLDLSFRAQIMGWGALYLPEVAVPAELPPQMAAFKRQQARWATGAAQCLAKLGKPLIHSRLSWPARLEGLAHLAVWVAHPLSLLVLLLTLPMLVFQVPVHTALGLIWLVAFGPAIAYALSARHLYRDWLRRFAAMPLLAMLGTGLALSNTVHIIRVLRGSRLEFRRTPKFRIERRGDRWSGKRYALPFDLLTLVELLLAGYAGLTVVTAATQGNWLAALFLMLYAGGYAYVGASAIIDALRPHLGPRRVPAGGQQEATT
ncbi:MAG: hypothetical protein AMJ93_12440 [Anaerolineae bacterium SM23_84]|nr:MAG: hypothetical protein AMJ93_12440 [Anaerolineae bacterium SM23_84]